MEETNNTYSDYKQSQKEWRDISVTQLSNTNNVLITLSSGLLAFIMDKSEKNQFIINFSHKINYETATYWCSVFILGISLCYGISVLLTRLYDFRISRHIILTRQRFYKSYINDVNHTKELSRSDLGKFNWKDRVSIFWSIIFCEFPRIETTRIDNKENIDDDFKKIRIMSKVLGTATWRWTKIQVFLFLLSGFIYLIHNLL